MYKINIRFFCIIRLKYQTTVWLHKERNFVFLHRCRTEYNVFFLLQNCVKVLKSVLTLSAYFVDVEKHYDCIPQGEFGLLLPPVLVWAQKVSRLCSWQKVVLGFINAVLFHCSCSLRSFCYAIVDDRASALEDYGWHHCCLQTMSSWPNLTVIFGVYWMIHCIVWRGWGENQHLPTRGCASFLEESGLLSSVDGGQLPLVEEFQYLGVLSLSNEKWKHEADKRIRSAYLTEQRPHGRARTQCLFLKNAKFGLPCLADFRCENWWMNGLNVRQIIFFSFSIFIFTCSLVNLFDTNVCINTITY